MRYAVLADVHGNLPALETAVAELRRQGVDAWLCAGDLVGYGPFPNECVELVRSLDPVCVAGNHDLIAVGRLADDRCIASARATLAWTREVLTSEAREYLESLPGRATADGVTVAHGSLDDPQAYVARREQAVEQLARVEGALVLGHTHRPLTLTTAGRLFLNPGAVGQSRELRVRARCAILDTGAGHAHLLALRYDTRPLDAELARRGLPPRTYHLPRSPVRRLRRLLDRRD